MTRGPRRPSEDVLDPVDLLESQLKVVLYPHVSLRKVSHYIFLDLLGHLVEKTGQCLTTSS